MPARAPLTTRSETASSVSSDNLNKGSGLTNAELDSNFINLRDQTIGIVGDDSTGIDVRAGDTIKFTGSGGATVSASGDTITITAGGGGASDSFTNIAVSGQSTVVADSSTDTLTLVAGTGMTITTNASTDTITFASSGSSTGNLIFTNSEIYTTNSDITLHPKSTSASGGTGNLNIGVNTATSVPDIVFRDILNYDNDYHSGVGPSDYISTGGITNAITCAGDLLIGAGYTNQAGTEDSTNNIVLDARLTRLYGNGTNAILTTAQGNDLVLTVQEANDATSDAYIGVNSGLIRINDGTNANIEIKPNGTGNVILDVHTWPNTDGTSGQVLSTNGAGVLSWTTVSGGSSSPITFVGDDSTGTAVNPGETFKIAGGTGITTAVSGDILTITATGGANTGDISFVGSTISSPSNADITLQPGGTGILSLDTEKMQFLPDAVAVITTNNPSPIKIAPNDDNAASYIKINHTGTDAANKNIEIVPYGTDKILLDNNYWPNTDGTAGQILTTNGAGVLSWTNSTLTMVGDDSTGTQVNLGETFKIAGANGVTTAVSGDTLTVTGSGSQLTFVGDDSTGTAVSLNETFKIAGAGTVTTAVSGDTLTITGASGDVVDDTTPQLGGNLDVNSKSIVSVSNGHIKILPNGTGRAILGTDSVTGSTGFYGNNSVYGAQMNYQDADWNAATGPQYPNPLARTTDWTLDASTTTSGRLRMIDAVELDMAGYNWNFSADRSAGPSHKKAVVLKNTGSSASNTLENTVVQSNNVEILGSGSNNSTITINNVIGNRVLNFASQDAGDTTNIGTDYGYLYQSPANYGSGTLNVTNEYGLYLDQSGSTATNNYGIYHTGSTDYGIYIDQNSANNRIGGLQFQYNRIKFPNASTPTTSTTLSWLYSKNTGPSSTQELYIKTGDGYETVLAPHNTSNQWKFVAPVALVVSSDPSTVTDTAHIYAKDVAGVATAFARDESGNVTQISPHNQDGEWQYYSYNTNTGKTVRINMEKMIRKLEEITGETFIENE